MAVYELDPLVDHRWSQLAARHPDACPFHSLGWLQALATTYDYRPLALTTASPGQPLTTAVVFCEVRSRITGRRWVSLPFSDHCQPLVEDPEELSEIERYLEAQTSARGLKYVQLRPRYLNCGLGPSWTCDERNSFYLHILSLRPDEGELFSRFSQSCIRRKIKRAERDGVTIECGGEGLLNTFYKLLILTRRRHGLPPQPLEWFRNVLRSMGDAASIWLAYKAERPIAGIFLLTHRAKVIYKYGCSDADFHPLGAMPLLFWRAIQNAKAHGATEFDFGRSEHDNAGLIQFKDHWCPERTELIYRISSNKQASGRHTGAAFGGMQKLISVMPDSWLTAAGRLLYRHVG